MIVAVVGSRNFKNLKLVKEYLLSNLKDSDAIVTGGAVGVDQIGMEVAKVKGIRLIVYYPNYHVYQKKAPLMRNYSIVSEADEVWAFWNEERSNGTAHSIKVAKALNKPLKVFMETASGLVEVGV